MKRLGLVFIVCVAAGGCTEPGPIDKLQVLRPGRDMNLTLHFEMRYDYPGSSVRHAGGMVKNVEGADMDSSVHVEGVLASPDNRVTMMVERWREAASYQLPGEPKKEESEELIPGPASRPADESKEMQRLRDARFIAVVSPAGRIVSADVTGKYGDEMKKQLAEAVARGATREQADLALQWNAPWVFGSLADAMAYLPPADATAGQSWAVRRKYVVPYHSYGFYMFTQGCGYSREESTCTLKSIHTGPDGQVAVVRIRGKRYPQTSEKDMGGRVKYLNMSGELTVNVTTGTVEKLHLESVPEWTKADEPFRLKLVADISLRPG